MASNLDKFGGGGEKQAGEFCVAVEICRLVAGMWVTVLGLVPKCSQVLSFAEWFSSIYGSCWCGLERTGGDGVLSGVGYIGRI